MAVVFQYGSNMSIARLNHSERLAGDAKPIGMARTVQSYELSFTVWSKNNNCAAATIDPTPKGRSIYGVVYEIPDTLITRESAKKNGRRALDAIEGEGSNYTRATIEVIAKDGATVSALTYLGKDVKSDVKTSLAYVQHMLCGLEESGMPREYREYVSSRIIQNNPGLRGKLAANKCKGA